MKIKLIFHKVQVKNVIFSLNGHFDGIQTQTLHYILLGGMKNCNVKLHLLLL